MSTISSSSHRSVWFKVSIVLCFLVLLSGLAGALLTTGTFVSSPSPNQTYIRRNVTLQMKARGPSGAYTETFVDPLHWTHLTLPVRRSDLARYTVGTKGTLVYRNQTLVQFQPNTVRRQNQQNLKQELHNLKLSK